MVSIDYILFVVLVILPWGLGTEGKKETQRYNINDNEWKRAQSIINKLVDESIATRVTEAEKDMTSLLQQNIEDHIKAKSKEYVRDLKKGCEDKIGHCDTLAAAGVCKTSKKAMQKHCAKTCSLCQSQYIQISPEVEIVMKPKSSKALSFVTQKVDPDVKAAALHNLFSDGPSHSDSSIEPLLSQQSSVAMKYHDNKDMTTENEKIKDAQKLLEYVKILNPKKHKAATHENASKKHITKKPVKKSKTSKKITGVPMDKLSKTVTYKNQKYKITPIVDWKKISKMLKSLGYKAIHIVGMKNKHLEKGLKDHLQKNGVTKVITGKTHKPHVAHESFVSAIHRQKSWHNVKWFKKNCHPDCLIACLGSCLHGCCKEHDKVNIKTGLSNHCHPMCKGNCLPSCGSGCCSPEEEKKRGHRFINYHKIQSIQNDQPKVAPAKNVAKQGFTINDIHRIEKPHPPIVNPKLFSPELYKPQKRRCPDACNPNCAPACSDECCHFGEYARLNDGMSSIHKHNPGLVSNVPFPHGNEHIPYTCNEACKFHCDLNCPGNCCQPEGLLARAVRLQQPYPVMAYAPAIQTMDQPEMCPTPCPNTCSPSCNVACCAAALGMPLADVNPEARSSTRKVLHIQHILHPLDRKGLVPGSCPTYCGNHCTPVCARSGCCMK